MKQIIIDLDGTLAILPKGSRDFMQAKVNVALVAKLKTYKQDGYKLILSSARGDKRRGAEPFDTVSEQVANEVIGWLNKHSLLHLFDEVLLGQKRFGELYIDDKGLPPEAFVLGLDTDDAWAAYAKSAHFKTSVLNWLAAQSGEQSLYLSL